MSRIFIIVSADDRHEAERAVVLAGARPDICVVSPSTSARETAAFAVGGHWTYTIEEPLLARRAPAESGADVLGRLARALRGAAATEAGTPLVVCDRFDILGATAFVLEESSLLRLADDLERSLPAS
jgi:hypothetical protein